MIAPRHSKPKPEPEREYESKQRRCLMCRKLFMSDWMGERAILGMQITAAITPGYDTGTEH